MSQTLRWTIALLMAATLFRAQTILFIPSVLMFGGNAPDAWLAPWVSDAILGFMLPYVVHRFWTLRTIGTWGLLVGYNAVGAFDYATGLATQWTAPMPAEMASATTVYLGIGVFMTCQLMALVLLFHSNVIAHVRRAPAASAD